jgi:hypothetical protein
VSIDHNGSDFGRRLVRLLVTRVQHHDARLFPPIFRRDDVNIFGVPITPGVLLLAMRAVRHNQSVKLDEQKAIGVDLNAGRKLLLCVWAGDY